MHVLLFYESQQQTRAFETASIQVLYEQVPAGRAILGHPGLHGYGSWWHSLATAPSPHFRSYQHQWASDSTMPCHEPRPKGLALHHSLVQGPRIFICLCYHFSFLFRSRLVFFSGSPSPEAQDKASTLRDSPVVAADRGLRHQRHNTPYP